MRVARFLFRVSVLMMVGVAVFCGLVLLFNAQVALNRYAELYMKDTEAPATSPPAEAADPSRIGSPTLASETSEQVPARSPTKRSQAVPPASATEGERATTIRVSNAGSVAAAAATDRWVDVVLTYRNSAGSAFSEVVLENVQVLAIVPIVAQGGAGERSDVHAVTLDVDAESAHNLVLASQVGSLSLVLRRVDGHAPSEAGHAGIAKAATSKPMSAHDESRFTEVTVSRGGTPTLHRVPRER